MQIKLDFKNNTLYELGYLATDINQLIVFCVLFENGNHEELEKIFVGTGNYALTRDTKVLKENRNSAEIKYIKDGSIVIGISVASLLATIIIPLIVHNVEKKINEKENYYVFEIALEDERLSKLLEEFEKGSYGKEIESLQWLLNSLSRSGYNVSIKSKDIYVIHNIINKYEKKIIKMIKK